MAKRKTTKEYVASGGSSCVYCSGCNLTGEEVTIEGKYAFQEINCSDCNGSWYDEYELTGYIVINEPPQVKDND